MGTWIGGCSAEKRYQVLSVFFDGVPDPNAPVVQVDEEGNSDSIIGHSSSSGNVVWYRHKPYKENKCDSCHAGASGQYVDFSQTANDPNLCRKCHKDVRRQYPVMHGPVAAGACKFCHSPHESTQAHLLKDKPRVVCMQCHEQELLSTSVPEHVAGDRSCLDCHDGHGGEKHNLLLASYLAQVQAGGGATTRPATGPTDGNAAPATRPARAESGGA
jgi:predicted CXXCH cytochrome family protein